MVRKEPGTKTPASETTPPDQNKSPVHIFCLREFVLVLNDDRKEEEVIMYQRKWKKQYVLGHGFTGTAQIRLAVLNIICWFWNFPPCSKWSLACFRAAFLLWSALIWIWAFKPLSEWATFGFFALPDRQVRELRSAGVSRGFVQDEDDFIYLIPWPRLRLYDGQLRWAGDLENL